MTSRAAADQNGRRFFPRSHAIVFRHNQSPPASRGAALVTGASSGIGRALAQELARCGYDLILVARDSAALESLAASCRSGFGVKVIVRVVDLADPGAVAPLRQLIEEARIPVEVLVNNAGFALHGPFAETAMAAEVAMVQVQLLAALELTKLVLPGMIARGRGRILNVASLYAFAPAPRQSVYGACKAFLFSFSAALANEVRSRGITVTTLCPGITATPFRSRAGIPDRKHGLFVTLPAEKVARAGIAAMQAGREVVIPGWRNRLFVAIVRHLPLGGITRVIQVINRLRGVDR